MWCICSAAPHACKSETVAVNPHPHSCVFISTSVSFQWSTPSFLCVLSCARACDYSMSCPPPTNMRRRVPDTCQRRPATIQDAKWRPSITPPRDTGTITLYSVCPHPTRRANDFRTKPHNASANKAANVRQHTSPVVTSGLIVHVLHFPNRLQYI